MTLLMSFKIFLSATLELHPDEAYYWLWSVHLDLGYFDHSPMVAYFIKATTLFSHCELAVRFSSIIVMIFLSFLIWRLAKKMFDEKVACASVIVLNTMPIMMIGSIVITPDTPSFFFFCLSVYFLWRLIQTNKTKFWYLTGFFFGLSLLSKYTAVLFGLSLIVFMVLDKKLFWFKNKHFYLMFVLAFIVFLPVVIWNYLHDWISFSFQLGHGLSSNKIYFNYVFEYFGAQALIISPFIFIGGAIASWFYFISKDTKKIFLASFCIPIILFFAVTALKRYPGPNWPAFAYFAFAIMASQFLLSDKTKKWKQKLLSIGIIFNIIIGLCLGLHTKYSIVPLQKISNELAIKDATNWFRGWKDLSDYLLSENFGVVDTRMHQWSAAIEYYSDQKIISYVSADRKNQYGIWWTPDKDKAAIGFKRGRALIDYEMEDDFTKNPEVGKIFTVKRNGIDIRQYAIIEYKKRD
jgi:undecaprenyl-diphosphatase